jgi:fido (protein-threonine AMPylation protein)
MPTNEGTYLEELINDFPCKRKISTKKAEILLQERYRIFEFGEFIPKVIDILRNPSRIKINPDQSVTLLFELYNQGEKYPLFFYTLSKAIHKYLFAKILSNAGEFRNQSEINFGFIGFGGPNRRSLGNLKFNGSAPENIIINLINSFCYLEEKSSDPLRNGLLFYRKFVRTHPFYDANGRIGRLILKIYLRIFQLEIQWDKISNDKLMKKMNECHLREEKIEEFEKYFCYLYNFMNKAIVRINEDDMDDIRGKENDFDWRL